MPDILVDFSPSRTDDDETADVAAELVAAIRDLGYDAGPETERFEYRGAGLTWTLALRWVGDHAADVAALGGFLMPLGDRVLAIFQRHRRPPPRHLQLYGPDGETVIARVEGPARARSVPKAPLITRPAMLAIREPPLLQTEAVQDKSDPNAEPLDPAHPVAR